MGALVITVYIEIFARILFCEIAKSWLHESFGLNVVCLILRLVTSTFSQFNLHKLTKNSTYMVPHYNVIFCQHIHKVITYIC